MHPLARDFGLTSVTELAVLIAGLAIVSLVGRLMGVVALGEYLLLRRVLAWLQPAELLGQGNALPRFVAYGIGGPERELRGYLGISLATGGSLAALICLALYAGRSVFGRWLFGSAEMARLILPLGLIAFGMTVHNCAYGYFRGRLDLVRANTLQALDVVIVPVAAVVVLARTHSIPLIVGATGLVVLGCALAACVSVLRHGACVGPAGTGAAASGLLKYGLPRVPGDFALGAFLALGPLVAMRFVPVSQVTSLLIGISILSAVSASATPVGTLMLSKVSMMLVQDRKPEVRIHLRYLLAAAVVLSTFVCLQLVVFTDSLLRLWLGRQFGGQIAVVRIILLAIPFYLVYCCLRGSVDAASVTAYNTRNLLRSLGLFVILLLAVVKLMPPALSLEGVAAGLLLASASLAALTLRSTRKLLGLTMPWRLAVPGLLMGLAITAVTVLARDVIGPGLSSLESLLLAIPAALSFALVLRTTRSPWLVFFLELAFQGTSADSAAHCSPHSKIGTLAVSEITD
ncbi:MAG TPA: hypothetical protein VGZ29_04740 [Terriglobia bacterium]|nr:hypothetical protein [Terriglobia bacterium]